MDFGGEPEGDASLSRSAYDGTWREGAINAKPGGTAGDISLLSLQMWGQELFTL